MSAEFHKSNPFRSSDDLVTFPIGNGWYFTVGFPGKLRFERKVLPLGTSRGPKNREKHKRFFFESEAEYLIPPKMKRTRRHDQIPCAQKFYTVFFSNFSVILERTPWIC